MKKNAHRMVTVALAFVCVLLGLLAWGAQKQANSYSDQKDELEAQAEQLEKQVVESGTKSTYNVNGIEFEIPDVGTMKLLVYEKQATAIFQFDGTNYKKMICASSFTNAALQEDKQLESWEIIYTVGDELGIITSDGVNRNADTLVRAYQNYSESDWDKEWKEVGDIIHKNIINLM